MLVELATSPVVKLLEFGYYGASILMLIAWIAILGILVSVEAFQVAGLFVLLTVAILYLAFQNERPD